MRDARGQFDGRENRAVEIERLAGSNMLYRRLKAEGVVYEA